MEGRQDERHAELLAAIGKADQPDRLQQLNRDDLAAFLQQKRCMAAAAQVQRLNLNGFALASVVDGLGWNRSPTGDFLLAIPALCRLASCPSRELRRSCSTKRAATQRRGMPTFGFSTYARQLFQYCVQHSVHSAAITTHHYIRIPFEYLPVLYKDLRL